MIQTVRGDATLPQGDGPRIIVHNVNDAGLWGAGFVLALSKRWPAAEEAYRAWFKGEEFNPKSKVETSGKLVLGEVQLVRVGPRIWVVNLVGQHGVGMGPDNRSPIRYNAIQDGLKKIYRYALTHQASIHMPKMGSGLARGNWAAVENLVKVELATKGISVTVYEWVPPPEGE